MGADGPPAGAVYYTRGSGLDGDFDLRNAVRSTVRRARAEMAGADSLTSLRSSSPRSALTA